MAWEKNDITTYLADSKSLVLATVSQDATPQVRSIGGYGVDGYDIYFATAKNSDKVAQISANPNVTLLFQHEGQQAPKNVTVYGTAEALQGEDYEKAAEIIKKRRPQLQITSDKNIYHIKANKVKILDFASENKIQVIEIA